MRKKRLLIYKDSYKFLLGTILTIFINSILLSQGEKKVELYPLYGTLFNHSPSAAAIITEPSYGVRFKYLRRPQKGSTFFEKFNYPSVGFSLNAVKYGDLDIFGYSFGAHSTLNFYLLERDKYSLQLATSLGAGYLTKEFENSYNNLNTAIGSNFNLSASILASFEYEIIPNFALKPSIGLLHYSNGRTTLPNLGTNFIFTSLGLSYRLTPKYVKDSFENNGKNVKQFRNEISLNPGLSDRGVYNNNIVLPTYSIHYNRLYFTSKINAIRLGLSAEYKNNDYDPAFNLLEFEENFDVALTVGDELFFGRTSVHMTLGVYLYSYYQFKKFVYQRWGVSYRLPIKSENYGISVGTQLKVHYGAAELSEIKCSFLF